MTRYGRFFAERVVPFSMFLSQWINRETTADSDSRPVAVPACDAGVLEIEWLIKKLVVLDPAGVQALRIVETQALAGPQSKDEQVWSRVIVEMIDDAFREAKRPASYVTSLVELPETITDGVLDTATLTLQSLDAAKSRVHPAQEISEASPTLQ